MTSHPTHKTVAILADTEDAIRQALRAVQADDATRDTALSVWLQQTVRTIASMIEDAA